MGAYKEEEKKKMDEPMRGGRIRCQTTRRSARSQSLDVLLRRKGDESLADHYPNFLSHHQLVQTSLHHLEIFGFSLRRQKVL